MKENPDAESLPTESEGVASALARLEAEEKAQREQIQMLMAEEDISRGISHAARIHSLKQERVAVEFQITFLKARLQRLKEQGV